MTKLLKLIIKKHIATVKYYGEDSYNIINARDGVKYLFNYGGNDWRLGEFIYLAGSNKFIHGHTGSDFSSMDIDVFKFAIPLDIFERLVK